jgi:hypothetical protein
MQFRVLLAVFSFVIALIATALIPAAYYGDKNIIWTKRLVVIAAIAASIFLIDLLRWIF